MPERILYLAWQDKALSRRWFPVARLDADTDESFYRFRYINGVRHAISAGGFSPFFEFPKLDGDYKSAELFSLFSNRVLSRKRSDRSEYLQNLDVPEDSDPIEVLSVSGGRRETDCLRFFLKSTSDQTGHSLLDFYFTDGDMLASHHKNELTHLKQETTCILPLSLRIPTQV